jgi:hypothetical protein
VSARPPWRPGATQVLGHRIELVTQLRVGGRAQIGLDAGVEEHLDQLLHLGVVQVLGANDELAREAARRLRRIDLVLLRRPGRDELHVVGDHRVD